MEPLLSFLKDMPLYDFILIPVPNFDVGRIMTGGAHGAGNTYLIGCFTVLV